MLGWQWWFLSFLRMVYSWSVYDAQRSAFLPRTMIFWPLWSFQVQIPWTALQCTDCLYEGSDWFVENYKRLWPLCYFQKKISTFYSVYQVTWKLDRFNSTKELTLNGCLMDIFFFYLNCLFSEKYYIYNSDFEKKWIFFVKSSSE